MSNPNLKRGRFGFYERQFSVLVVNKGVAIDDEISDASEFSVYHNSTCGGGSRRL